MKLPSPHGDKLIALLENSKFPKSDKDKAKEAIHKYQEWVASFEHISGNTSSKIEQCVRNLNSYKNFIEIDLIFSSKEDFLYRQKGQLKLDNSVLEEFLPLFVYCIFKDIIKEKQLVIGPTTCISGIRFDSSLINDKTGGGIELREKDQDFAISKKLFIQASHYENFQYSTIKETSIAYLACECKTNLDKTMFQEASATALDLKSTVPSAKYLLLCEWLDMTPISTSTTAIDEIIILRKAKRLGSQERKDFSTYQERQEKLTQYRDFILSHPFAIDTFTRFIEHIESLIIDAEEGAILTRGYF